MDNITEPVHTKKGRPKLLLNDEERLAHKRAEYEKRRDAGYFKNYAVDKQTICPICDSSVKILLVHQRSKYCKAISKLKQCEASTEVDCPICGKHTNNLPAHQRSKHCQDVLNGQNSFTKAKVFVDCLICGEHTSNLARHQKKRSCKEIADIIFD
jgi:ribosomal protein S27E